MSKITKVIWIVIECIIILTFVHIIVGCSGKEPTIIIETVEDTLPNKVIETVESISESTIGETESLTEIPSTELPTSIFETITFEDYEIYYTSTRVNIRTKPSLAGEVVTTLDLNSEVKIVDYVDGGWSSILYNEKLYWIFSKYLSKDPIVAPEYNVEINDEFHYYGVWSGEYWHFTPEQIDSQWAGYKKSKPALELGTTRAWQKYLYEELCKRSLGWWYKYACAQAMQESGFNPLNHVSTDHGLFSFRERYWDSNYGDIYDYHANIQAYIDRIYPYLVGVNPELSAEIDLALSQHYNPGYGIIPEYVNAVRGRLNELWICD